MIRKLSGDNPAFALHTKRTTYALRVTDTGQLEHLYYGRKIHLDDPAILVEKHAFAPGNTVWYDNDHPGFSLEDMCLETSAHGKGDIREPMLSVMHENGDSTLDFVYQNYTVSKGKTAFQTLPGSYDESGQVDHLLLTLRDKNEGYLLELHYYIYEEEDVITRSARFINAGKGKVRLERFLSLILDFNEDDFCIKTFHY